MKKEPTHLSRNPEAGFTLVEVLTVILIIVTLVGFIIGVAQYAHGKSAEGQCIAGISQWTDLLEQFKEENGWYPGDPSKTTVLPTMFNDDKTFKNGSANMYVVADTDFKGGSAALESVINGIGKSDKNYENLPSLRDPWGSEYRYRFVNEERYEFGSLGADRKYGDNVAESSTDTDNRKIFGQGDDITKDNGGS